MNSPEEWSVVVSVIALGIPATLALAAVISPRRAGLASGMALGLAALVSAGAVFTRGASPGAGTSVGVRVDVVTCVMLLLVGALGAVVVRYSERYLQGEPGLVRYRRWFC